MKGLDAKGLILQWLGIYLSQLLGDMPSGYAIGIMDSVSPLEGLNWSTALSRLMCD